MRNFKLYFKICIISLSLAILTGCAVGKMLMSGYTPPATIADLMREQYGLAGELPPELQNNNGEASRKINIQNYAGNKEEAKIPPQPDPRLMATSTLYRPSFTHKGIEDYAAQLIMQMLKTSVGLSPDLRIGVSSFVMLDESLQTTTVFGNQLSEYMITEMQKYGLAVIDHKLQPVLNVTNRGDIVFSRDVNRLSKSKIMDYVMSGTMIEKVNGIFVNARIISIKDNRVIASAHLTVPDFVVAKVHNPYVGIGQ